MKAIGLYTAQDLLNNAPSTGQQPDPLNELVNAVMARIKAEIGLSHLQVLTKLPDGSTRKEVRELDGADEAALQALLGKIPGEAKTIPKVDVRGQLETYLNEGGRSDETKAVIRRSLVMFLDLCEAEALPYDSKIAASKFKSLLKDRSVKGKPLTTRTINFHIGRVSQFLQWLEAQADWLRGCAPHPRPQSAAETLHRGGHRLWHR